MSLEQQQRIIFLLGYATALVMEVGINATSEERKKMNWLFKSVENVVYKNEPIPEMP